MNEAELSDLLAQLEGSALEFKRVDNLHNLDNRLAPEIISFANSEDGVLVLGVDDSRNIVGLGVPAQRVEESVTRTCARCVPSPTPTFQLVQTANGEVLVVSVPRLPKSLRHCALRSVPGEPWRCYVRRGSHTYHVTPEEYEQMLLVSGKIRFEETPVRGAAITDLDENKILGYLKSRSSAGALSSDRPPAEIIRSIDLPLFCREHEEQPPNVACVLLFARQPQRFLIQSKINAVQYAGLVPENAFLPKTFSGTADELIDGAEAYVHHVLSIAARIPRTGTTRLEQKPYPDFVIREALANAVMHRDYSIDGEEIALRLFSDRLAGC